MLAQIKQVLNTYLTQRLFWLFAVITAVMTVPTLLLMFGSQHKTSAPKEAPVFVVMPLFFTLSFLVGHAKSQLAHSRARLTPNFFPSHVVVLGVILLLLLVLFPLAAAAAGGLEPLGILALILGIGSSFLWGNHLNRIMPMLIGLATFYSLITPWGKNWWILQATEHQGIHATIAIAGIALVVAWLWRICHLREEDDDYQNVFGAALARRSGSEAVEERRIVAWQIGRNRLTSRIGDWWHSRIGDYYGGSSAGRARVLRYGFSPIPIEVQALFFALMIVSMGLFFSQFSFMTNKGNVLGRFFFPLQFAVIIPGYIGGELMARRRARIANEMLLPVSRTQLIDSLFTVSAGNSAKVWLIANAALGVVVLLSREDVSLRTIGIFALLSATLSFITFGLSMRTSVWPSTFKRLFALWFSMFILGAPMTMWTTMHKKWGDAPFVLIALALLAIGALLLYSARRAWLNLEFT